MLPAQTLELKLWRAAARPGDLGGGGSGGSGAARTATGSDVCVTIDAETRGMHVQQTNPAGPIVIVGATGDAAVRGMRRGDLLTGVHHIPLPARATLQHVQQLMESLPRPLALNLYRPSPYDSAIYDGPSPADGPHPLPLPCAVWRPKARTEQPSSLANGGGGDGDDDEAGEAGDGDDEEKSYQSFFRSVVRNHKGYLLTELHHKDDPESTRLEPLLM